MFACYLLADLCEDESIPFVLVQPGRQGAGLGESGWNRAADGPPHHCSHPL